MLPTFERTAPRTAAWIRPLYRVGLRTCNTCLTNSPSRIRRAAQYTSIIIPDRATTTRARLLLGLAQHPGVTTVRATVEVARPTSRRPPIMVMYSLELNEKGARHSGYETATRWFTDHSHEDCGMNSWKGVQDTIIPGKCAQCLHVPPVICFWARRCWDAPLDWGFTTDCTHTPAVVASTFAIEQT